MLKGHLPRVICHQVYEEKPWYRDPPACDRRSIAKPQTRAAVPIEREFLIHNLLVRIHFVIVMIK